MCVTRAGDGMNVAPTALPEMPAELKALFDAQSAAVASAAVVPAGAGKVS